MFCDSNKRHLNAQQLWRGIEVLPCGDLDLHSKIHLNKDLISSADMIVVNVGVNDTSEIEGLAPNAKIIISELTPRNDKRDPEVQVCNARINLMKANNCHPNVTIACHQNLRNSDWSFHDDAKHLSKVSIARFASTLKSAFRKAFGIYKSKPLSRVSKGNHHQQQFNNTKYTMDL